MQQTKISFVFKSIAVSESNAITVKYIHNAQRPGKVTVVFDEERWRLYMRWAFLRRAELCKEEERKGHTVTSYVNLTIILLSCIKI